jgi:hypothetical protein
MTAKDRLAAHVAERYKPGDEVNVALVARDLRMDRCKVFYYVRRLREQRRWPYQRYHYEPPQSEGEIPDDELKRRIAEVQAGWDESRWYHARQPVAVTRARIPSGTAMHDRLRSSERADDRMWRFGADRDEWRELAS